MAKPSKVESQQSSSDSAQPEVELSDEENLLLNLLKTNSPIDLNELKGQTGLSNKKWDIAIKVLRKHNLAKVEKTQEGFVVSLVSYK